MVSFVGQIWQALDDFLDEARFKIRLNREIARPTVMVLGAMYGDWGKEQGYKWGLQVR